MRCAICNGKTDWDSSFGYNEFIVCYPCYSKLVPPDTDDENALNFIFKCGKFAEIKRKERRIKNE